MKQIALLAFALALVACAQTTVPPERAKQIHTLGIVSTLGIVTLEHAAAVSFNSTVEPIPSEDWKLDEFVTDLATQQLKGRFDIRPVTYDRTSMYRSGIPLNAARPDPPNLTSISPQGLDAYLIIAPAVIAEPGTGGLPLTRRGYAFYGLGLAEVQGVFRDSVYAYHAPFAILLIDGHDQSVIARRVANDENLWRTVDKSIWPTSAATMTAEQKERLRDDLKDTLERNLPAAISQLKLAQ